MTKLSSEEADKVLRNYPFYREFIETENQLDTNTKLDIFLKDLQGYRAELLSRGVSDNYMEEMVKLAKAVNYLHTKYGKNELINGFKQFMNALEEYNNKNSPGSFLFSFIRRTISKETEEKDLGERKRLKDDALNKENKGKIIGLGFDFNKNEGLIFFGGDISGENPDELRIDIDDAYLFSAFLHIINKNDLSSQLKKYLVSVAQILETQITRYYNLNIPDDKVIEVLGNANPIIREYRRLDLIRNVKIISLYKTLAKRKCLKEYIVLNKSQCFQKPGEGFGPGDWHRDASPDFYERKWENVRKAVDFSVKNPKSYKILKAALKNIIFCIEHAERYIKDDEEKMLKDDNNVKNVEHYFENYRKYIQILRKHKPYFEAMLKKI